MKRVSTLSCLLYTWDYVTPGNFFPHVVLYLNMPKIKFSVLDSRSLSQHKLLSCVEFLPHLDCYFAGPGIYRNFHNFSSIISDFSNIKSQFSWASRDCFQVYRRSSYSALCFFFSFRCCDGWMGSKL